VVDTPRIEVDGRPATAELLAPAVLVNYGHMTAMQVRGGRVRGLDLHLRRLAAASRELFDVDLPGERVRGYLRHAVGDTDASVRLSVHLPDGAPAPSTVVAVRPPVEMPAHPQRLRSVPYTRPAAHLKHVGTFGQIYHQRRAERDGYDDVLLTGPDGVVAETSIANIGFFDGAGVVWPAATALEGITLQLLEPRLPAAGLPSRRAAVHRADLASFRGAFLANSRGVGPVASVDDVPLPVPADLMAAVARVYDDVPWDRL
jgi:branched-subunit amino acid aminotransferase/4-amino-4-deoxychorismate lyase